ncbi:uridine 5' monophosphate synthase/orotate phosphoribosyltransferase [Thermoascus aurantiacus ATCC 26904]
MSTATIPPPAADKDYKATLLPLLVSNNVLSFGSYILKSGRESPYFFTSSLLHTAPLLRATASAYASVLSAPPFVTTAADGTTKPNFDILFGPAYKGIPLCAAVVNELAVRDSLSPSPQGIWDNVSYSFNRKEAKDHGEGGGIVGAPLKGKRVVIIDDVITAGTALREAVGIIQKEGGTVAGVVVLLDREERVSDEEPKSAVGVAQRDLGESVPVRAVIGLSDLIEKLGDKISEDDLRRLKEYRARYGAE